MRAGCVKAPFSARCPAERRCCCPLPAHRSACRNAMSCCCARSLRCRNPRKSGSSASGASQPRAVGRQRDTRSWHQDSARRGHCAGTVRAQARCWLRNGAPRPRSMRTRLVGYACALGGRHLANVGEADLHRLGLARAGFAGNENRLRCTRGAIGQGIHTRALMQPTDGERGSLQRAIGPRSL